jgi:hypothetical protein
MTLDDFDIPKEHISIEHIREVCRNYKHVPSGNTIPSSSTPYQEAKKTHLIFVSLKGAKFYINGEKELVFKTRGDNVRDLANACSRYDIDFWECDFDQVVRDMAGQLQAQAEAKNAPIKLEAIA